MNKKNTIVRFIKTSITYFVGNVSTKLISFFLIPIYTAYLNPSEYGGYDLIISILNLIVPLAFVQIWDGVFRFAFDKNQNEHRKFIINNGFIVAFGGIGVLMLFNLILSIIYPSYITKWVVIYGICYAMQYYYTVIARVNLDNLIFSISGVVNSLITALSNIYMIKYRGMGVDSLYIAASIGILIQILMIEIRFKSLRSFKPKSVSRKCILDMIRFSLPLCISTIAYWMLNGYAKILISNQLGVYDNGLYAVANKFTSMVLIVVSVFQFAWNEMVYIMSNEKDKTKIYQMGIRFIFSMTMSSGAIFIFISRLIFPFFVDIKYHDAITLIPISMVGVTMSSFSSFAGTLFLANKKSGVLLSTTIYAVIANIVLSSSLISKYRLQGTLVALTIALSILALSRLIALYKQYKIYLGVSNYLSIILLLSSVVFYFKFDSLTTDIIAILLITIVACLLNVKELRILYKSITERRKL